MSAHFVNEYSAEKLSTMDVDEINKAIADDLFEDAYETQKIQNIKFEGKNLAEGLESLLFICPACKKIGTLSTKHDFIRCTCGFYAIYTPYAYLKNSAKIENIDTITKWNDWQKDYLAELLSSASLTTIFNDEHIELKKIDKHHRILEKHKGNIKAEKDRIIIAEQIFLFENIIDMALYGRNTIVFSLKNSYYEIKAPAEFCGWKYFLLFDIFKNNK